MQTGKPYALNEQGRRDNNEDAIFPQKDQADEKSRFFMVCDGMGGHENGEVASASVCDSFAEFLKTVPSDDFDEAVFDRALNFAFDQLDEKDDENSQTTSKMGTTLTFLCLNNKQAFMAHIGDSRIYQLRKNEHGEAYIVHKTSDHSLVNELLKAEVITEEEAANHPKKNVLNRAMQPHLKRRCKAEIYSTQDIEPSDRFFLCSDGIVESVSDEQLCSIATKNADDEAMINAIRLLCEENSHDNFSAWLISIVEGIQPLEQTEEKASPAFPPRIAKKKSKLTRIIIACIVLLLLALAGYYLLPKETAGKNTKKPDTEVKSKPKPNGGDRNNK